MKQCGIHLKMCLAITFGGCVLVCDTIWTRNCAAEPREAQWMISNSFPRFQNRKFPRSFPRSVCVSCFSPFFFILRGKSLIFYGERETVPHLDLYWLDAYRLNKRNSCFAEMRQFSVAQHFVWKNNRRKRILDR